MSFFDIELDEAEAGLPSMLLGHAPAGRMVVKNSLRVDQLVDVLLVTRDEDIKRKIVEAFEERNRFRLRTINARVSQFADAQEDSDKPELLILDLNTANTAETDALERLKKSGYADIPIIVISSYLDQETVRALVQVKVDDWLPKDCSPLDVYRSCERVLRSPVASKPEHDAACYTFLPVGGGAGNTTIAIETAFILGRKDKKLESTCLVDLNFQDGSVADYLDLTPAFKIEELSLAPGRLDRQLLDIMLTRHSSGVAVLAAPRSTARYLEVSDGMVASVLGLLSKSFDNIVIDLPRNWCSWTDNVIWGSNKVFVVCPFTVPALRQARFVAEAVAAKAPVSTETSVLINKFHEPFFNSGLLRKDAERLLGARLGGFLPDIGSIATEAINRGIPVSDVSAGNKLDKRLAEILRSDLPVAAGGGKQRPRLSSGEV